MKFQKKLLKNLNKKGLSSQLKKGAGGGLLVRIVSLTFEFLLVAVLARSLGSHGYGIYVYAFAIMRLLAIPAQAGMPTLVVREISIYRERKQWSMMRGLVIRSNQTVLLFSLIICLIFGLVSWLKFGDKNTQQLPVFLWAATLLPFIALGNIRGATLRGLRYIVLGQLPENILRPLFFLSFLGLAFLTAFPLTPAIGMALQAGAAFLAFIFGAMILIKRLPKSVLTAKPEYDGRRWAFSALSFSLIMGMMTINNQASLIVLGLFHTPEDVGIFGVSVQMSLVATMPLTIINITIAPYISKLFILGKTKQLQIIATISARIILVAAISVFVLFFIFGEFVIELVFGSDYLRTLPALLILSAGYCFSAITGTSMIFLNMTGNEKGVLGAFSVAVTTNLVCNFILVPQFGLIGAAISTATSITMLNFIMGGYMNKKLKLNPMAFGRTT